MLYAEHTQKFINHVNYYQGVMSVVNDDYKALRDMFPNCKVSRQNTMVSDEIIITPPNGKQYTEDYCKIIEDYAKCYGFITEVTYNENMLQVRAMPQEHTILISK